MRCMNELKYPKIGLLKASRYIADFLLIADGSIESVKDPRVRFFWHLLLFSLLGLIVARTILSGARFD